MSFLQPAKAILAVDRCFEEIFHEDLPVLAKVKAHVLKSGGKRLRPLLVHFLHSALGGNSKKWVDVATVAEVIHAASLLHDDVVDLAERRRNQPTINALYGNKTAILSGDYLLACGIQRLTSVGNLLLLQIFSQVLRDLSVSELLQMQFQKNPKIQVSTYEQVIYGKTASLFGACAESACILLDAPLALRKNYHKWGVRLGLLFQKRDDALDYFVSGKQSGKVFLKDFDNGLFTYPILLLREKLPKKAQSELNLLVSKETKTSQDKEKILELMDAHQIRASMESEFQREKEALLLELKNCPNPKPAKLIQEQIEALV